MSSLRNTNTPSWRVLKTARWNQGNSGGILQSFIHQSVQVGEAVFLIIYNASSNQKDLNWHRYSCLVKTSTKVRANLVFLLTKAAAAQQARRVFLQTQIWLGNTSIDPQTWYCVRDVHRNLIPFCCCARATGWAATTGVVVGRQASTILLFADVKVTPFFSFQNKS